MTLIIKDDQESMWSNLSDVRNQVLYDTTKEPGGNIQISE